MSQTARRLVEQDRRLAILSALFVSSAYTLPAATLRRRLEVVGFVVSLDALAIDVAWLDDEAGLVERLELDAVRLTERGADVVLGRSAVPGVTRQGPGGIDGAR